MQLSHSDLFLKFSFGKQPLSGIQNSKNYTFFKNESQFKTFICFPHEFSSLLKFSEEATEFEKISHLFWNLLSDVKKSGRFFQIFVQNFKVQKLCWFLLFFDNFLLWGDCLVYLESFLLEFSISVHCVVLLQLEPTHFFFLRISLEFSFLLYLMKVKKAAPSAACNDVEMYCEACMKKIWLGSSLGSFDVYLYQLSTKGLGPRYKEIRICGLRC